MRTLAHEPKSSPWNSSRASQPSTAKAAHRPLPGPKLTLSSPGDRHEQEADRIADQVMHTRQADPPGQTGEGGKIRRAAPGVVSSTAAPPIVQDVLRSPGQPLEPAALDFMQSRFGHDFSQVRVHADTKAAESSRAVHALAYTVGQDVVFGAGQYAPRTSSGRRLIAHELAHVLQNGGGRGAGLLSRYTLDDCESTDHAAIRRGDARATVMAGRALGALRKYAEDDPGMTPGGQQDQRVTDLLIANFGFEGSGPHLRAVTEGFRRIDAEFTADDYQYECEDDCDTANAYVYSIWTDIHLCMNKLRGRSDTFVAGVMLHEMSHYAAGTDDLEYFYSGSPASTGLNPTDAVSNADSYEGFAEELYKQG